MIKSNKKKTIKKSNIDYVVAIPTYKRYNEITTKTLPTLKRGKVNKKRIYVFVANKTKAKFRRDETPEITLNRNPDI